MANIRKLFSLHLRTFNLVPKFFQKVFNLVILHFVDFIRRFAHFCGLILFGFFVYWNRLLHPAINEGDNIINIYLVKFSSFDLVFSWGEDSSFCLLAFLLVWLRAAMTTMATVMAFLLRMFASWFLRFNEVIKFQNDCFDFLLDRFDFLHSFVLSVFVKASVVRNDDLYVMLFYDFLVKNFKMPQSHVLLQLSLYFNKRTPHFHKSVNTLINNLVKLIDLINEVIIELKSVSDWLWSHLFIFINIG